MNTPQAHNSTLHTGTGRLFYWLDKSGLKAVALTLQRAFSYTLPLILVGAFALMIRDFPLQWVASALTALFGESWRSVANTVVDGTLGLVSLAVLGTLSSSMAKHVNQGRSGPFIPPQLAAVISLSSLFILTSPSDASTLRALFAPNTGLLTIILVTAVSCALFIRITRIDRLQVSMATAGHDPVIRDTFRIMPACIIMLFLAVGIRAVIVYSGAGDLLATLYFRMPHSLVAEKETFSFGLVYAALSQIFWFFGTHGPNMLYAIEQSHLLPAGIANAQALADHLQPTYIYTKSFFDIYTRMGGSGSTLCLILALAMRGRARCQSKLCLFAIIPAIFNVNEPILLGLPIILNPAYLIPFLLTPVLQTLAAYIATAMDLIPHTTMTLPWTTPALISGYLATGSVAGSVMQLVNLALGTALYLPFVSLDDALHDMDGKKAINALMDVALRCTVDLESKKCLNQSGEVGRFAKALTDDLAEALQQEKQLFLVYQPQYDTQGNRMIGAEALLRWQHPVYGLIPPPVAVALAEDAGMMQKLGELVLFEACSHRMTWSSLMPDNFTISVNVSPRQLHDSKFAESVLNVLRDTGLAPHQLELEISESSMIEPTPSMTEAMKALRGHGIRIAIDDFGMGHASLRYLRAFPVDTVKIDRSLTLDDSREINDSIVRSIVELGKSLNITTIVEGVEHLKQLDRFDTLGCSVFQGYLFSKPILAEDLLVQMREFQRQGFSAVLPN